MRDAFNALVKSLDLPGKLGGPLDGATFVAKDNIEIIGEVCANGSPDFASGRAVASAHAPAVERLLASGATLVGKTHMDEMAYSLLGDNPRYSPIVNPASPGRLPGGSSSGSAVAVASGLCDVALGTDTAGSCRAPASFCGIFGFRPSHGSVSLAGVVPLAPSFDTIGWFARDADRLIAVAQALTAEDLAPASLEDAAVAQDFLEGADEEVARAFAGARRRLGVERTIASLGGLITDALPHFRNFQAFEAHQSHGNWIETHAPRFSDGVAARFAYAASVTARQKQAADAFRVAARRLVEDAFAGRVILCPTTPFAAPRRDESPQSLDEKRYRMFRLFLIASFFGLPQVSIPLPVEGPPIGLSLIGPRWSDRALLRVARDVAHRLA